MPEKAAQSTRADADAAATQAANDAADNANLAAKDARDAADRVNDAIADTLQVINVEPDFLRVLVGDNLNTEVKDITVNGKTYQGAIVEFKYPAS